MRNLNKKETKQIVGGANNWTGTLFNAFKGIITTFFEIGQAVGGAIRRISSDQLCSF